MDVTPKVQRKFSLSLNRLSKRQTASPQNRLTASHSTAEETPRSPSVLSIYSDSHTPPHRKLNLDDSLDYSPKCFDTSFSPSGLLSQSVAIDSPEVGWRWTSEVATTTPDSAYADSSFTSAGSSTKTASVRTRGASQRQVYQLRREEHRKTVDLEIHRAEKVRADDLLKKRCAKLQEQLKEAESQRLQNAQQKESYGKRQLVASNKQSSPKGTDPYKRSLRSSHSIASTSTSNAASTSTFAFTSTITAVSFPTVAITKPAVPTSPALINNSFSSFFNDSDTDCMLLEATQQLELKIQELTQKTAPLQTSPASTVSKSLPVASTTPTSSSKEKRSSFYMKFLEEDSPEDWFESLDEAVRLATQETQAKKPRTSLQRYNSMPAATTTTTRSSDGQLTTATSINKPVIIGSGVSTSSTSSSGSGNISDATVAVSNMKRHASTYSLSTSSSSHRGRHLHLRK